MDIEHQELPIDSDEYSLDATSDYRIENQELPIESYEYSLDATSDATLEVIQEYVSSVRLCCRLESLLLQKRLLNNGDTPEAHAHKVEKLKVVLESLLNSTSKTERRISDQSYTEQIDQYNWWVVLRTRVLARTFGLVVHLTTSCFVPDVSTSSLF